MLATKPPRRLSGGSKSRAAARLEYVAPAPAALVCKTAGGVFYELPFEALQASELWDGSGVAACEVIDGGQAAAVILKSGARLEVPVDFILHRCEPAYAFHISKVGPQRVGARVKALREGRGLRLEDLSRKTGLAVPNLSRLEHDKHVPTWETLGKVAKALGVTPLELLSEA